MKMQSKKIEDLRPTDVGRGISVVLPLNKKPSRTLLMSYRVLGKDSVIIYVADPNYPRHCGINIPIHYRLDWSLNFCSVDRKKWGYMQDRLR